MEYEQQAIRRSLTQAEICFLLLLTQYLRTGQYSTDEEHFFMAVEDKDFIVTMHQLARHYFLEHRYQLIQNSEAAGWLIIWEKQSYYNKNMNSTSLLH